MGKTKSENLTPLQPSSGEMSLDTLEGAMVTGSDLPVHLKAALDEAAEIQARAIVEIQKLTRERAALDARMAAREKLFQERSDAQLAQFANERDQHRQELQGAIQLAVKEHRLKIEDLRNRTEELTEALKVATIHEERQRHEIRDLSARLSESMAALEQSNVENDLQKQEIVSLTGRLDQTARLADQAMRDAEEHERAKRHIGNLTQQVNELSALVEDLRTVIAERDRYKGEVIKITAEFLRLSDALQKSDEQVGILSEYQQRSVELSSQFAKISSELEIMQEAYSRLNVELALTRRKTLERESLIRSIENSAHWRAAKRRQLRIQRIVRLGRRLLGKKQNALFDANWYLEIYPDVRLQMIDPYIHYMTHGWKEGRQPNVMFDPAWYLNEYPDVQLAKVEPLSHYLQHGALEGRIPHPLFPVELLAEQFVGGITPLERFLRKLGRLP